MNNMDELVEAMEALSPQDVIFAEKYLETFSAQQANKTAYPDRNPNYGFRRLQAKAMRGYIQARRTQQMESMMLDANRVITEIGALAFTDVTDVVDWDTSTNSFNLKDKADLTSAQRKSIKKISLKKTPLEHGDKIEITVEMHDKLKAISMLDKHLNVLGDAKTIQVNQQNNVTVQAADMTDEQLLKLISGQGVNETIEGIRAKDNS